MWGMNKPEYSDYYKFIVSLGFIFIVFSVLVIWLFIRDPFDSRLSAIEFQGLTNSAQELLSLRQDLVLFLTKHILLIASIPAFIGLLLLLFGLFFWKKKQDYRDFLENEKLRLTNRKLSPAQVLEKAISEVSEEENIENLVDIEPSKKFDALRNHLRIEQMAFQKLYNYFGKGNVITNTRIGNIEIDAIVRVGNNQRIIFEIKVIRNYSNLEKVENIVMRNLSNILEKYNRREKVSGICFLILSDNNGPIREFHDLSIKNMVIKAIVMKESDFASLTTFGFGQLIYADEERKI
jgi:hypothetical protein